MNRRIAILREAIVVITQVLAGKKIKVTQRGMDAFVEFDSSGKPKSVNLPYLPDNASDALISAIQGFLDHEVAHILFSDFGAFTTKNQRLKSLANILEDARIEKLMSRKYPGCGSNLTSTGEFFLGESIQPKFDELLKSGVATEEQFIGILAVPILRSLSGQYLFEQFMDDKKQYAPTLYRVTADLREEIENLESSADVVKMAQKLYDRLFNQTEDEEDQQNQEEQKDQSGTGQDDQSESEASNDDSGAGEGQDQSGSDEGESEGEDANSDKGKEGGDDNGGNKSEKSENESSNDEGDREKHSNKSDKSNASDENDSQDDGSDGQESDQPKKKDQISEEEFKPSEKPFDASAMFEEMDKESANNFDQAVSVLLSEEAKEFASDADYLVYTNEHDVIETLKVGRDYAPRYLSDLQKKVDNMTGPIQKDLERAIQARSRSTWESGLNRGRLNGSALARLKVGDNRVFRRKQDNKTKDVAVTLMIDCSGSMSGNRIAVASQTAYALASVLDRLNIKSEVIGFTTGRLGGSNNETFQTPSGKKVSYSRTENLYMPVLKQFEESFSMDVKERFAWLPNASFFATNIDGESVGIGARRLILRREARKILIVLSDGQPNGSGSASVLNKHLRETVKEIELSGVDVVGIGIDSEAVRQFYPKSIVIRNVEELPTKVIGQLRDLLVL